MALVGCSDGVADRFDAQVSINIARFGEDERLGALVSPGVVLGVEAPGDAVVALRASAPYPALRVDNGTFDTVTFDVSLDNVDPGADVLPRLVSLDAASRRDARCDGEDEHPQTLLAPITPAVDADGVQVTPLSFSVTVPRCASYAIDVTLPRDRERWTALVAGGVDGSAGALASVADAAQAAGVDYVHVLGGVTLRDEAQPMEAAQALLADVGVPHGVTPSAADLDRADDFYATFGQTDYVASVGALRWLALETSSGRVSAAQLTWLDGVATGSQPTLAAMSRPPIDAVGVALDGLRSTQQGGRVVELLRTRGTRWLVSSSGDASGSATFADIAMRELARAGSGAPSTTVVEVLRPWPALVACGDGCDAGEACVRGFCRATCVRDADCLEAGTACDPSEGLCRLTCDGDAACPGPVPTCSAGWCELEPEVRFSR